MSRVIFIGLFLLLLFQPALAQNTISPGPNVNQGSNQNSEQNASPNPGSNSLENAGSENVTSESTAPRGLTPAARAPGRSARPAAPATAEAIPPETSRSPAVTAPNTQSTSRRSPFERTTRQERARRPAARSVVPAQPSENTDSSEETNEAELPTDTEPLLPEALTRPTESVAPSPAASSLYRSEWAKSSVRILEENGITLPAGVNYDVLIAQDEFVRVLAQASLVPVSQLRQYLLDTQRSNSITRGEAIHLLLGAFGLIESLPNFAEQTSKFTDLPPEHPAYASIVLAERVKLINGYPDRTIRPNEVLSWGEALILVETVYSWRKALPTTAPEWVKKYEKRQNMWYQLIDGFRLLLTLAYVGLALYFILKNWYRTRHRKDSPYRRFSIGLSVVVLLMSALWISELLFNYDFIPRDVYAVLAMISIFVGLFLLKLSSDIDGDLSKPKPQVVIDQGYIEAINHERGELFIRDKASNTHSLALVTPDSKVSRRTGRRSSEPSFLSDIQVGDEVSLRGQQLQHDSLLEVERLTQLESQSQQVEQNLDQYTQNKEEVKQKQQIFNQIFKRPPKS